MAIDPRFEYETYERNIFATREELTGLARIVLDTKTSVFSVVVNAIRIAALFALFYIRKEMMAEEMMIGRQIYQRRRSSDTSGGLKDDLDGIKK